MPRQVVIPRPRAFKTVAVPARRYEPHWDLAFAAILALLIFQYSRIQLMFPVLAPLHLGKVLVVVCIGGLFIARRPPGVRATRFWILDVIVVLFLLAHLFSAISARYQGYAWSGCLDALTWVVCYFLISRTLNSSWRLSIFVLLLLLLNLKLAQFSVRTYFSELGMGRSEQFLSVHGVGAGSTDFFGNAGDFGVAMCVVWPLAGALFFGERKRLTQAFLAVCFLAFMAAIYVCGSRGALVGAAAAALVAWITRPNKIAGVLMVVGLLMGVLLVLPQANRERLRSALTWRHDPTASIRIAFWTAGIRMFENHPILGVGPDNFPSEYANDYAVRPNDAAARLDYDKKWDPHSIYIQSLSQLGLAGTIPFVLMLFFFFDLNARTRKRLRELGLADRSRFEFRLSRGLDLAMVGYLVSGAFITVLYYPHLWFLLGIAVGLHRTCSRLEVENHKPATRAHKPLKQVALTVPAG